MLKADCRGARIRAGYTQEGWAAACCLSLDRVRALEYREGEMPGWDSAYRMALLGGFLRIDGPLGSVGLAPLNLIAHPEVNRLYEVPQEVKGQLSLFGRPVVMYVSHVQQKDQSVPRRVKQTTLLLIEE